MGITNTQNNYRIMDSLFLSIIEQLITVCAYNSIIHREKTFSFNLESLRGISTGRKSKLKRFLICIVGILEFTVDCL
jgi:hypothetical protein